MTIVRTFMGTHIDLSKIVSISDAYFIDNMGHGGWFVGFQMYVQLLNEPIRYMRKFNYSEEDFSEIRPKVIYSSDGKTPLAVENLQKQIDDLVSQWILITTK